MNVRTYRLDTPDNADVFAYLKKNKEKEVLVILNLSSEKRRINIIGKVATGDYKNIFSGDILTVTSETIFELAAWEYQVYER